MSRLAGNVPGVDHQTIRLSQEAATNSPNISQYESLSRASLIPALSQLYPIFIGSIYRLLLWRDNVKYHGSTRWSIIFSPLINYTECQTITGVLWDSIGLYVDCKSSFLLRKTKIIYNLPTITLEAAYHDVLYLISFFLSSIINHNCRIEKGLNWPFLIFTIRDNWRNKRCLNKGESDGLRPQLYEPFFMWTVIFSMVPSENWI